MKNKYKKFLAEINTFVSTEKFLIIFLIIILNNIYGIIGLVFPTNSYIDSLLSIFTGSYYILILQISILISVYTTIRQFEHNYALVIRLENRKKYMKELLKKVIKNILIILVINLIIVLLMVNLFKGNFFRIVPIKNYNILNITYLLFYLLRFSIIVTLNGLIFIYISKITNKKISLILCLGYILSAIIISLPKKYYIFYFEYLDVIICDNFVEELIRSILFIGIIIIILKMLHNYTTKNMKKIEC